MKLAEKIQSLLDARNISLRDAGSLLGPSYGTVARWVNGKTVPRLDEAARIAAFFGVPIDYLADDGQDRPPVVSARRRRIEELIAKLGEEAALDRLSMVPAKAPEAPPARRPSPPVRVEIDGVERTPDYVKPRPTASTPARSARPRRRKA